VLAIGGRCTPGPEAYLLEIGPEFVLVRGASAHGVFNGIQTLAQLLEPTVRCPAAACWMRRASATAA
jgi:hypothetical protein